MSMYAKDPQRYLPIHVIAILVIVAFSLALFFLIYAIYILLAHTSLKRSVLPE